MTGDADFAYVQARLQARHGTRLSDQEWRRLEALHDPVQYLHRLHNSSRARWVERIAPGMSSHLLEARLRAEWRSYARDVASFHPESWRAAIAWTAFLIDLPVLDHLLRGGPVHSWMAEDEIYAPWCRTPAPERQRALDRSPVAALLHEARSGTSTPQAWLAVWRRLCPRLSPQHSQALEEINETVAAHCAAMRAADSLPSFELRMTLKLRLCVLFRLHFETAAASLAHLLLEVLDLERLRAGLVRRMLRQSARVEAA
jgi:hypothetical protein